MIEHDRLNPCLMILERMSDGDSFIYPLANGEWILTVAGDNIVVQDANAWMNALHVLKDRSLTLTGCVQANSRQFGNN